MTDLLTELQCTLPPSGNCYRLSILGSSKVGKTAIVRRFLYDDYHAAYIPTVEEFHRKVYKIRNEVYQLDIVDTSGIHPFPAMRRLSFLTGDAFILVYSIDCKESFKEVLRLREEILESIKSAASSNKYKGRATKLRGRSNPGVPMIIAGNKCDLQHSEETVTTTEVEHTLQRLKDSVSFVECSAKDNINIVDLFETLFMLADFPEEMIPNAGRRISLTHGGNVLINSSKLSSFGPASTRHREEHGKPPTTPARHGITLRRRLSDAYSALITNVRRPSIKADLVMVRERHEQPSTPRAKHRRKRSCRRKTSKNSTETSNDSSSRSPERNGAMCFPYKCCGS